ncbi:MAG: enoyl-CoA hydratase [Gemmatimonadetes bacterium]|uniref:Enoyl-CoA hydratase n=1 Tax=Candidatus Kutchimonas denitrificans TaxID=3056748 RepID=A0AAE4Z645_9BACT|nr:enoyl-CoA hydratase [Gemmatimonadota bacterium]NIR74273.1 enoyl-CoA hydratase [Candidatus Kutchimonas denitrificans]NIS02528.1 enoyl-CoA hydratase [Gemmatimonadota bacterium]NIT68404.1 enoyl-CoA hydratase [Gemmatimonadota bacterium]NIU51856.1 2-(1,2-epoxy-1,2-dihydrophenyl)acetyl-CoA isomerase [Gemmatimonadota bacterium]
MLVSVTDGIGTITLNRPDRLNSFADQMRQELAAAVSELAAAEKVRVIVITGAGRGFCTGADVTYLKQIADDGDEEALRDLVEAGRAVVTGIRNAPQPVIASVNGPAAGGGANLALACDIRIASDRAAIGQTFNRIGLHPDWGGSYFLPRLVGPAAAAELIFTGEMVPADEAHRLGLFNRVVPHERLAEETEALARQLADKPQLALRLAKIAVHQSLDATMDEMLDFELAAQLQCGLSPDGKEGIAAFVEKREPRFRKEGPS